MGQNASNLLLAVNANFDASPASDTRPCATPAGSTRQNAPHAANTRSDAPCATLQRPPRVQVEADPRSEHDGVNGRSAARRRRSASPRNRQGLCARPRSRSPTASSRPSDQRAPVAGRALSDSDVENMPWAEWSLHRKSKLAHEVAVEMQVRRNKALRRVWAAAHQVAGPEEDLGDKDTVRLVAATLLVARREAALQNAQDTAFMARVEWLMERNGSIKGYNPGPPVDSDYNGDDESEDY